MARPLVVPIWGCWIQRTGHLLRRDYQTNYDLANDSPNPPLSTDGSVNGNAGCNGYRGPYTVAGSRITFGPIVSTKRACLSQPLTDQETAFLAALGASTSYELVGDRLTLRDDARATQVVLVRPSVQPVPGAP